jgi:predicted nucleotidyltransferase
LIESLIGEFAGDPVRAMLLTGSYARNTATRYSDVDLVRFVDALPAATAERYTLRYRERRLVSISTTTVDAKREELRQPETAIFAVEGLRRARTLLDRDARLTPLLAEAAAFDWAPLQPAADAYANELLMGLAEETHKALTGLERGDESLMLFASHLLVGALPRVLLVQRGILLVSENDYLDDAQRAAGHDSAWSRLYRQVTGLDPLPPTPTLALARARAALRLYVETARQIENVLTGDDGILVAQAVATITTSALLGDE